MRLAFYDLIHNALFYDTFIAGAHLHDEQEEQQESPSTRYQKPNPVMKKIVVHVFGRYVPPEEAASIREKHLQLASSRNRSSSGVLDRRNSSLKLTRKQSATSFIVKDNNNNDGSSNSNNDQTPEEDDAESEMMQQFGAVPGSIVFEAKFMKPTLHLSFVLCKGDEKMPPLSCQARHLEKAILQAAKEVIAHH